MSLFELFIPADLKRQQEIYLSPEALNKRLIAYLICLIRQKMPIFKS